MWGLWHCYRGPRLGDVVVVPDIYESDEMQRPVLESALGGPSVFFDWDHYRTAECSWYAGEGFDTEAEARDAAEKEKGNG